jgi:magnesium transporter
MAIPAGGVLPRIHVIDFTADHVEERDVADPDLLLEYRDRPTMTWVDVQGLGDEAVLRRIGEIFGIHPLALADVVNTPQRPKSEAYEAHRLFIAYEVLADDHGGPRLDQVSLIIGRSFLLSFQEEYGDVLDPVRVRLRSGAGGLRRSGADYLAYSLIDTLVDSCFPVVEGIGERLERIEKEIIEEPERGVVASIYRIRRELLLLRRTLWPQREAIHALIRDEDGFLGPQTRVYLRDCYDHSVQVMDIVETYREMAVGLMDIYMSSISNRLNEVMKVLTLISSLFIPMTLLVGIYGMNFEHMPELHSRWGYPAVWVSMLLIAAGMLVFFHRRGWLRAERPRAARRRRRGGAGDRQATGARTGTYPSSRS